MFSRTLQFAVAVTAVAALAGCGGEEAATPPAAESTPGPAPSAQLSDQGGSLPVPRIPPERQAAAFEQVLAQQNLTIGANPDERRTYALTICDQLDANQPFEQLIYDVQAGTGFPPTQTGYVIGAAAASYCPQNLSKLPTR